MLEEAERAQVAEKVRPEAGGEGPGEAPGREAGAAGAGEAGAPKPPAPEPPAPEPRKPVRELTPRELGTKGEDMAAGYLERKDWEILARNWRCRFGEVDIVAREAGDDETVVLVEVKTRLALGEGASEMPELAVDGKKRRRYRNLALAYVVDHPDVDSIRFDVIALNVVGETQARLRHLRGAFGWDD